MKGRLIVTHSGSFHTDDVCAVATVTLIARDPAEIIRTRDPAVIARGDFVIDVGGIFDERRNRFDHHQEGGAGCHPSGIPYASFGLVWRKFGAVVAGRNEAARRVEEKLVIPIDAHDNGISLVSVKTTEVSPYLIQDVVSAFAPTWQEADRFDNAFREAVSLARTIITREVVHAHSFLKGEQEVLRAYVKASDKRMVVLKKNFEWKETLTRYPEPLFVIEPEQSVHGGWKVRAVHTDPASFESRVLFPPAWAGKRDHDFASVSGVSDAIFCHNQRFIAISRTKEGAVALVKKALKEHMRS